MARVNLVMKSDVATVSSKEDDVVLVHTFRERMSAWLSQFGHVAVTSGLDRTTFSSIHDESTFSIAFPPGDFALKWVEVMLALQTLETIARKIWADIAPGVPATVTVTCVDVDGTAVNVGGKGARASHRVGVSDVLTAPMRPLLALVVTLFLVAVGWFARPTPEPPQPPQQVAASAPPPSINLQFCNLTATPAASPAPRRRFDVRRRSSRIYRSEGPSRY